MLKLFGSAFFAIICSVSVSIAEPKEDISKIQGIVEAHPELRPGFELLLNMLANTDERSFSASDLARNLSVGMRNSVKLPISLKIIGQGSAASSRAEQLALIFELDLDSDWKVTQDEMEETFYYYRSRYAEIIFDNVDQDTDGSISLTEAAMYTTERTGSDLQFKTPHKMAMVLLDLDSDQILTEQEVVRGMRAISTITDQIP